MRKFSFFLALFILHTSYFIFRSPVLARDPIIIDQSILGPPAGTGQDYNYHSNDILKTNTVECPGTFSISNTFNPIQTNIGSSGPPTWQSYPVNFIQGILNLDEYYTNRGVGSAYTHFVGNPQTVNGDSFLSLNTANPGGASGMANRSTPYRVLECQKAQRLIYAILSLNPAADLIYDNEHLAWNCSNKVYTVLEKKDGSGCTPIRLADIAVALAKIPMFYHIDVNCNSSALPQPTTLFVSIPHPNPVSATDALELFNQIVTPVAGGSVATNIKVCDKDKDGHPINCQEKQQSIPLGGVSATNQATVSQIIPSGQSVSSYPLCNTLSRVSSADKPNPLSFLAKVIKFFGNVTDTTQTWTDSTEKTIYIDSRVNIDQDQAFLNNLIPAADQAKYQTTDRHGSSTDNKIIHPGNPVARSVFANELLPANF